MTTARRKIRKVNLTAGRPPKTPRPTAALSASATRTLIRSHHRLHKELHKAKVTGDVGKARQLQSQIDADGGLESYQQASILGQSKSRGGDSSVVLMQWLKPSTNMLRKTTPRPRLLEVGALSTYNACSGSQLFEVTRIDLNSQDAGILQQDFMQRPLPTNDAARFDVISLSLVLNYVPDATARGDMLRRTTQFLLHRSDVADTPEPALPLLFFVLPAPCVTNSRYMDSVRLEQIMNSLGYELLQEKLSAKLIYQLWSWTGQYTDISFAKTQINPGAGRNNFSIVLNAG